MGLTVALRLKECLPQASITVIDKEKEEAFHASSRNSGVLHAGFYYTADSLKAKFTVDGNRSLKEYCRKKGIALNECGKLVVATNQEELDKLSELFSRGQKNGSRVEIVSEERAKEIEPNVRTYKKALYSPDTASVNPKEVCQNIKKDLENLGVTFFFGAKYCGRTGQVVHTTQGDIEAKKIINCAGLYADKVAHDFGFGKKYTMIPFKGLYLKYTKNKTDVRTNIYPVPNLKNPFLGVHFTKTVYGDIKIGPTAIPAFWRENYSMSYRFNLGEALEILGHESMLFLKNSFGFRDLAFEEMNKYNKKYFVGLAQNMVQSIDPEGFTEYTNPGIRAQLLDKTSLKLVQDFVVEGDDKSIHVLNAVSPAFTCSLSFSSYIVKNYIIL